MTPAPPSSARRPKGLTRIDLSAKQSCDVEMISVGAFSPLTGFMGEKDFNSVIDHMTLADGTIWPIPITLAVAEGTAKAGDRVALYAKDSKGNDVLQAVMTVEEVYAHDTKKEATIFFNDPADDDGKHPGAEAVKAEGPLCLAGPIEVVTTCVDPDGPEAFLDHRKTPAQTRAAFEKPRAGARSPRSRRATRSTAPTSTSASAPGDLRRAAHPPARRRDQAGRHPRRRPHEVLPEAHLRVLRR
jgi:ATP sulfurylase